MSKLGLALDFDGVIHSYVSGWCGEAVCPDPPVPGALDFIRAAVKRYSVYIYSTRATGPEGFRAIRSYLLTHGLEAELLEHIVITSSKPKAVLYIDDRAHCFTGTFPSLEEVAAFKPWTKRQCTAVDSGGARCALTMAHLGEHRVGK